MQRFDERSKTMHRAKIYAKCFELYAVSYRCCFSIRKQFFSLENAARISTSLAMFTTSPKPTFPTRGYLEFNFFSCERGKFINISKFSVRQACINNCKASFRNPIRPFVGLQTSSSMFIAQTIASSHLTLMNQSCATRFGLCHFRFCARSVMLHCFHPNATLGQLEIKNFGNVTEKLSHKSQTAALENRVEHSH